MNITRILVLGIALVAGGAAAFLAFNLSTPEPTQIAVSEPVDTVKSVEVLVASDDIAIGSSVDASMIEWRAWPKSGLSPRFINRSDTPRAIDKITDAIARASFFAGEPIIEGKLIRPESGFLSAILPAGKRAVATNISADTSAGGFILPNDRVDLIMTRRQDDPTPGSPAYITETVLNNVRVLAIDQTIEDQNGEQVVVGQTATLELTPEQAKILTVAQQLSERLTLALRSIADSNEVSDGSLDAHHLISGSRQGGAVTVVKNGIARDVGGIR
ncbi:MAG: Flp pilus assembly protein CpaB [Alphaproteobacteria bacterium]